MPVSSKMKSLQKNYFLRRIGTCICGNFTLKPQSHQIVRPCDRTTRAECGGLRTKGDSYDHEGGHTEKDL